MSLLVAAKPWDDGIPAVSPWLEMGAYEALWARDPRASFRTIADMFKADPEALPSDFVEAGVAREYAKEADALLRRHGVEKYGVRIHGAGDYALKLRHARNPVEMIYYQGTWELTETPCVAVVGTRKPSNEGKARARRLAKCLVEDGFTVVSGLAEGIDTVAHTTAIEHQGKTIAVIGTPLGVYYPPSNEALQKKIAREHLLISQVPVLAYESLPFQRKRTLFPERNITMSALTDATIIVEAGETSGTLTQARAALYQGRKLFILNGCFECNAITWPERFERQGAVRVREYDDIKQHLAETSENRSKQHQ